MWVMICVQAVRVLQEYRLRVRQRLWLAPGWWQWRECGEKCSDSRSVLKVELADGLNVECGKGERNLG